ncbi:zinc-binding metallopeptidase family protein [Microvirga pudoricolor]|uniref:zinc-binding metallopeptidase family protein n=1 Tax=Microvirga pudoricolor TaxID=2778729 RepID=UPI00194F6726|nr:putative zinc-binding peptidase [Microvirga pudoricolor]MBM6594517.1 putative zinc-binding metallopeptidase [Microvirga pudoricolor]
MKLFQCQNCGQLLYFENRRCERCGFGLGYLPDRSELSALTPRDHGFEAMADPRPLYRFCSNAEADVCNWLVPAESHDLFCLACRHNRIVPNLSQPENGLAWQKMEAAKHRLFYTLLRLRLPLLTRQESEENGLVFDFPADPPPESGPKVMTGHDEGLITIALVEADDAERERRRTAMGEPYRTLLGHFRHEVGHYYWDRLVRDGGRLEACRAIFGDDRVDYGESLQKHYRMGPPPNWQENYVTAYAATHPWEDFAETWAHYLHIVDTLEMARAFNVDVRPDLDQSGLLTARVTFDPYEHQSIDVLVDTWLPMTFALNGINRCMGIADLYPFVLSPAMIRKLGFINDLVHDRIPETATRAA